MCGVPVDACTVLYVSVRVLQVPLFVFTRGIDACYAVDFLRTALEKSVVQPLSELFSCGCC